MNRNDFDQLLYDLRGLELRFSRQGGEEYCEPYAKIIQKTIELLQNRSNWDAQQLGYAIRRIEKLEKDIDRHTDDILNLELHLKP